MEGIGICQITYSSHDVTIGSPARDRFQIEGSWNGVAPRASDLAWHALRQPVAEQDATRAIIRACHLLTLAGVVCC
jgi:hypothetical protein